MNDNNKTNFYIVIKYQDRDYQLLANYSSNVGQLKKIIITHFKLNKAKYEIFYKNSKLDNNDTRPLSVLFEKDPKPLLYILDSKKDALPNSKNQTQLTLFTNISAIKMYEIIEKFFEYKKIKNDTNVKNSIRGMYIINFTKASLCSDFKEFYDNYLRLDNFQSSNRTEVFPKIRKSKLILPIIKSHYQFKEEHEKNKDDKFHDRKKYLNRVILNNSRADSISENCIRTGRYRMHISNNKNRMRKKYNNYIGLYNLPYMNNEEKYQREKYLDKKNWINKQGFISYPKDKSKDNFIPNYVMATPSESPLLFNFRNVSKNKWINPKGFL